MHPNPAFRPNDRDTALEFARARGFGVLTVAEPDEIMASHVPFVLRETEIRTHLVRSNPIARALKVEAFDALLIVSGPDAYISPDWYLVADQVPTWNYVAVHIRGRLRLLEDEALEPHLEELSEFFETQLLPKKPWHHSKMSDGVMDRMMRQILPVAMEITTVASTWKLNQNKDEAVRKNAAHAVEQSPIGHQQEMLAKLMRGETQSEKS